MNKQTNIFLTNQHAYAFLHETFGDLGHYSRRVLKLPLHPYQLEPLQAVLQSIRNNDGDEFLLVFPRQSGKNEAVAQFLVFLMNVLKSRSGNIVYGAIGDGLGRGIQRLEQRLENEVNKGQWLKGGRPLRRAIGRTPVVFVSSHPSASTRGETARHLLVIDELQDQDPTHVAAVFTPMRAAHNATALYLGTVRLTTDALWQKKSELERQSELDGRRRVFFVTPTQVTAANPRYGRFLARQEARFGRHHPIIASEYYLEPIDAAGRLFDPRRQSLMRGPHPRQLSPQSSSLYVATLDVAGQDEAATDPLAALANPGRDYTIATLFQITYPTDERRRMKDEPDTSSSSFLLPPSSLPHYRALDVFVDHGSKHFQDVPGRPRLAERLLAWLTHWQISHLIADESGVGQGLVAWLAAALGPHRVTPYNFAAPGRKASLGSRFLSLVETGRFHYWTGDEETPLSDGWYFWQQVAACRFDLPPGGRFEQQLRWGVPPAARLATPAGSQPIHDDRLLSAALIAELDALLRAGQLHLGTAHSTIIPPANPFQNLSF
jgi:hypothetical protein